MREKDEIEAKILVFDNWRLFVDPMCLTPVMRKRFLELITHEIESVLVACRDLEQPTADIMNIKCALLASAVFALRALLLYEESEKDTESVTPEGRWLSDVGVKCLPFIAQLLSLQHMREHMRKCCSCPEVLLLKNAVADLIQMLSWNNDNKGELSDL
jgi:hypothetical protein